MKAATPLRSRDHAYERFTQDLLARKIRPGEFITQRELVELTGLTLASIRELIPRLEAEGLITTVPQRGLQIPHLDLGLVRDAYELRTLLEVSAVKYFVKAGTDAQLSKLVADHAWARTKVANEPISQALLDAVLERDWRFHDTLIDAMRNQLFSNIYRVNSIRIRLIRLDRPILSQDNLKQALTEHGAIIKAMQERSEARAVAAMERHMASALQRATGITEPPIRF